MASSNKLKDFFSIFALVAVFLLSSIRYYPGRWQQTLVASLEHILAMGPFTVGGTLVIASLLQKMAGERLPWKNVFRLFLTISIVLEFFLGIAHYVKPPQ